MRILTVVSNLGPGGTERVAQNYSIGYKRFGCEVGVLAYCGGGIRACELKKHDIEVFIGGKSDSEINNAIMKANNWNPNIIHIHRTGYADKLSAFIMSELKNPSKRIIETNVFARVDYSPARTLIDVHLLLSKWCLWKWTHWSKGINPSPIGAIVPNSVVSTSFFKAKKSETETFRRKHRIPKDCFLFGRVGQPLVAKWSSLTIAAFKKIACKYNDAHLLLVGFPDELNNTINLIPSHIRKRITLIPFLKSDESLRICYSAIDIFIHAAKIGESFGMVLVEAMLCGCPVITLSTPAKDNSQLEVVGHKRGGLVVSNKDELVTAMDIMLNDNDLLAQLSKNGHKWVKTRYDIDIVTPLLLRIAEIAYRSQSSTELKNALENDSKIITRINSEEIKNLMRDSFGEISIKDRLLMRLVHIPLFYRNYLRIREHVRTFANMF